MPLIDVTYDGTVGEEVLRRLEAARLPAVPGELARQHRADQTAPDRRTGPSHRPAGLLPRADRLSSCYRRSHSQIRSPGRCQRVGSDLACVV